MSSRKRNPLVALICSLFCPGLGQLYVGNLRLALLYPVSMIVLLLLVVMIAQDHFWPYLILFTAVIANILGSATQAFISAKHAGVVELKKFQKVYVYLIFYLVMGGLLNVLMSAAPKAFSIPTDSMAPTLVPGDKIIANLFVYSRHAPELGDVVIYTGPSDEPTVYVKRIVGLSGDKIKVDAECNLYRNGTKIERVASADAKIHNELFKTYEEKLGDRTYRVAVGTTACENYESAEIPADQFFVMGDNRANSKDSRYTGPIPGAAVMGRASFVYWGRPGVEIH